MVRQRVAGMEQCRTKYALFCDDDISFPADFVKKLYAPIHDRQAAFSAAPLYSFLPEKGFEKQICCQRPGKIIRSIVLQIADIVMHREIVHLFPGGVHSVDVKIRERGHIRTGRARQHRFDFRIHQFPFS